jgi:hypothetical protein
MIILLSTGLHDWKIKYLVSCNKGPSPFNDMLYDFDLAVPFILPTPLFRREFGRKRFVLVRILFQVYFDFTLSK